MRNHGYIIALSLSNLLCIDVTSMIVFTSPDPQTMYLSFFPILSANIPTSPFHLNWKKPSKLPFLDVEITRSNGRFSTSVYRKPTFSGLFTKFHSFVPSVYKRSLVCCLLHRIFHLCSSYENFHAQLEVVRTLFNLNGFPTHMFDQLVRRFLKHLFELLSSLFLRKSSIFAFLSLAYQTLPLLN